MASIGKQDSGKAELENRTVDTMVGDGSATTLVLSSSPISINNVLIFISGIMQRPTTDYTLSGSTITFSEAPIAGLKVVAITGGGEHIGIPLTKLGTDKFMESAVTDAKIATGISASKLTGALPALDGSAVTGASGANVSGVDTVTTSDPTLTTNPASAGHIWLNNTSAEMFVCTDNTAGANVWINVGEGTGSVPLYMTATNTNGTETIDGDYKVVTFNTSGTFTPTVGTGLPESDSVEYLVIAGGGAGGYVHAGAGGAGGYRTATNFTVTNTALTVTVGAGAAGNSNSSTNGSNGSNSIFSTITSDGGGGGGHYSGGGIGNNGSNGGSGGGGSSNPTSASGVPCTGGLATSGQGFNGGAGFRTAAGYHAGGGGGGAGAVGGDGSGSGSAYVSGNGGVGLASSITGTSVIRAGGGGGGGEGTGGTDGTGGAGGGGDGQSSITGGSGTANTGGGGGGVGGITQSGSGGSGVVIIRYQFQ